MPDMDEEEEQLHSPGNEAAELMLLHDRLKDNGSKDEAFASLAKALAILESDPREVARFARALEMLVVDLEERGEMDNAKRALEELMSLDRTLTQWDPELELIHLNEYSKILVEEGDIQDGSTINMDFINRASYDLNKAGKAAISLRSIKSADRRQDVKRLAKLTEEAISRQYGIGSDQHLYSLLQNARVHYGLDEIPEAIAFLDQGLGAAINSKNVFRRSYLLLLEALADIQFHSRDFHDTAETINREMAVIKKLYGEWSEPMANTLTNLSRLYRAQGEYRRAEEVLVQAIEIADSIEPRNNALQDSRYLLRLDIIFENGEFLRVVNDCRNQIASLRKNDNVISKLLPELYLRMGEAYMSMDKLEKAEETIMAGLTLVLVFGDVRAPICKRGLSDLGEIFHKKGDIEKVRSVMANPLLRDRKTD